MANKALENLKTVAQKGAEHVDVNAIKSKATSAANVIGAKA